MSQAQRRRRHEPYAIAQSRQRKAANLARQAVLQKEREEKKGHPVLGPSTRFIRSLTHLKSRSVQERLAMGAPSTETPTDDPSSTSSSDSPSPSRPPSTPTPTQQRSSKMVLNYGVHPAELHEAWERSRFLTTPLVKPGELLDRVEEHQHMHENARTAMARIVNLANGDPLDVRRVQRQRCIDTFGRHKTDQHLAPRPDPNPVRPSSTPQPSKTPRAGPDTGSPEVQIAMLTLRIRSLADHLAGTGRMDRINKRNLHLLVHKRQGLLKYLRRKDRGASRWQFVVQTLGLADRTWQGEISPHDMTVVRDTAPAERSEV